MNVSDWVLIVTTLFLGFIALFGPLITDWLKRRLLAPVLTITFSEEPPYCIKTFWNDQEPVYYFRFQASNTGRTQLKRCEAVLEELWIYNASGKPNKVDGFSDVNLPWAGTRDSPFMDMNPRRRFYCDVGHISSLAFQRIGRERFIDIPGQHPQALRFMLDLLQYPNSQPNCFVPGKYAIKISLFAENVASQDLFFEIVWSGKWQNTEEDMFRELVISRINRIRNSS